MRRVPHTTAAASGGTSTALSHPSASRPWVAGQGAGVWRYFDGAEPLKYLQKRLGASGAGTTSGSMCVMAKKAVDGDALLRRVRDVCMAMPEVTERPSHGAPTWFVRDKKTFVMFWVGGHHDLEFPHLWCAAPAGAQEELVAAEPERFFRPPYVGHRGWIGVRMDVDVDWDEIAGICEDAFRCVAPRTLIAKLDAVDQ